MPPNTQITIGEMSLRVVVSDELIESFDATMPKAGLGPDLHYHTAMDEIFYVQSGKIAITRGDEEIIATPGMIVRVPKMTRHGWKSIEGPARMLFSFIPGGRQAYYLAELGELANQGASWREGIGKLQEKYDNKPL